MKPLTFRKAVRISWRAVAGLMLPVYFLSIVAPLALADNSDSSNSPGSPELTPRGIHANKKKPKGRAYAGVSLPADPTDRDITYSHAFREPLVPVGGTTNAAENQALASAIKKYLQRKDSEDLSALTGFISQYPQSPWQASLDLNLSDAYFDSGRFSKSLSALQDGWALTQKLKDPAGLALGNLIVGKLAKMEARIGRTQQVQTLFAQIEGRTVTGAAAQWLMDARSGLWLMQNRPQEAFRCGPSALQEISVATRHGVKNPKLIKNSQSTDHGVALSDVQKLAASIDMPMQMAKRSPDATFIVPAVVHWKVGHYAALVGKRGDRYEIHDTTFGSKRFLVSAQTLQDESSGYFLVPIGTLPQGWSPVSRAVGENVFGRGNTGSSDPSPVGPNATPADSSPNGTGGPGGDCGSAGGGGGNPDGDAGDGNNVGDGADWAGSDASDMSTNEAAMTEAFVSAMLVSLNLVDTPVRYTPPLGPSMHFTVQYNQRDSAQPGTFAYSNLGPNWTFSYLSYVTPGLSTSTVYQRGGGLDTYQYNSGTSTWYPSQTTQSVLSQINSTTWQRALAGGEIETFGQQDGSGNFFLTQITDPHGNSLTLTYDGNFRITSLTDALGQVTTITYRSNTTTDLPAFYEISKVTDPFGRYAQFDYDTQDRLQQITDIMGITSKFAYSSSFISSLTTPYGVTSFTYGDITTDDSLGVTRWLEITYPDGNKTRTEYSNSSGISNTDSPGIPSGMYSGASPTNDYMEYRNTFYWDKQAMKDHPGDYTKAKITHWLHTSDINTTSGIEESHKSVDQNRIWFNYSGELSSYQASDTMIAKPIQVGRIMDDGTTAQIFTYAYNALGKVTQKIDPLGRETDYTYDTNNIDLLTVKQKRSSGYDTLATYTYNSLHEPLAITDAAGETTTNVYYSNGELHTTTNPKSQVTTFAYDANGYLTSITGPVSGATTSYIYDSYGRVRTVTDSQGYVTTIDYDAMDRPTQVSYPDSTTSQILYQNLDAKYTKDRLGRWTHVFYNALRQPIATMDAMGHVTNTNWTLSAGLGSIIDASGHFTAYKYDGQNRLIEKDYPDSNKIQIAYENTTSRIASTTDAAGQVATNTYNLDNTVEQTVYTNTTVSTPTVSYTYDSVYPRLSTMVDGTGTTTYTYVSPGTNGAGQVSSVVTPLSSTSFTYDQLGRQLSQSIDGASSSVTYDSLGRVATATTALSGTAFSYSYLGNTGRVSSITYPNSQSTTYTYQDSSTTGEPRLSEIKNLNASSAVISKFDYSYDSSGQITSWTQQTDSNDPQNYALRYDNAGRLINATLTDTTTSTLLHQYVYSYDAVGNRTGEQIDGNVTSSSYNNLNQLTGQSAGGKMVFSGTVSKYATVTVGGNSASLDSSNNFRGSASVTTGTNDVPIIAQDIDGNVSTNNYQVVVPSGSSTSYTYDANGNLLTDPTRSYSWDAKNELVKITYADTSYTAFTYNALGQRVKIQEYNSSHTLTGTKQYVWEGSAVAEERDGSNVTTKRYFAQGEQRVVSGTATSYYYTRDHLGSVREMMASNGTTIDVRYSYDPYGRATQVSGTISCDFGFTGYYVHATSGLLLSATRAYDPNTGRFIQRDPSGEGSGLNLYAYCANSPINLTDPSGLCPMDDPPNLTPNYPPALLPVPDPNSQPPTQAQLAAAAVQHFEDEGYPPAVAQAMVDAGVFAINNDAALQTANAILMAAQMADGAGEAEASAGAISSAVRNAMYGKGNIEDIAMAEREAAAKYYDQIAATAKTEAIKVFNEARAAFARNGGTPPGGITKFGQ